MKLSLNFKHIDLHGVCLRSVERPAPTQYLIHNVRFFGLSCTSSIEFSSLAFDFL